MLYNFSLFTESYAFCGKINLFNVKSIFKIIIHVLKLLEKNFECFTSRPNAHGTFWNCILKLIKNSYLGNEQMNWIRILHSLYFHGIEYKIENHKIVTINMEIPKFSKTQS